MREALFIKKNAEKWKAYQQKKSLDPDEAAESFITLMDDLAYAKTFYPKSKVTQWINGIASAIYQSIYYNKRENLSRIWDFWKYELPLLFRKYHKVFLFTTIIFSTFVSIGFFSGIKNPDFPRSILGDDYVNMTEENIAKGDPFGVYRDSNPFSMFVRIAFNNIKVAFITFVSGFTLGLFTLKILWSNGIMLGSFQYLFYMNDLGIKSVFVIWIHGTIEISSIIIAGTAGFILGNGILFPGTFSRLHSFRTAVKDAAKIMVCLIPFFVFAAFLESYITHQMSQTFSKVPGSGMPVWASALILAGSLMLILWYFVLLPVKLSKRGEGVRKDGVVARIINK